MTRLLIYIINLQNRTILGPKPYPFTAHNLFLWLHKGLIVTICNVSEPCDALGAFIMVVPED